MTPHSLHSIYQRETGMIIALTIPRMDSWTLWSRRFTEADLVLLLRHLKRGIASGTRNAGSLKLTNLLFDLDKTEEDLALAKAEKRNFRPAETPKENVIRGLRPVACDTPTPNTAKPISAYIEQMRAAL